MFSINLDATRLSLKTTVNIPSSTVVLVVGMLLTCSLSRGYRTVFTVRQKCASCWELPVRIYVVVVPWTFILGAAV